MTKKGFEFQFKNPTQDAGDALTNVLFINDAPSESDILRLELAAVPDVTLTLNPVDEDEASDDNYHFKLTCRPEALAQPDRIVLDASHDALWSMVCIPETAVASTGEERAPGDVDFYFLYKHDKALEVTSDALLSLTLRNVGAASKGGTRPTVLQLTLNKRETDFDKFVVFAGPPGEYNLTENANLDLIAPRGQSAAPTLMAGFASSDIVLNDGDTESYLLLRIVNNGLLPISLAPAGSPKPTKLTLRFEASDDTTRVSALGKISQVSSILIPGKPDSTATDPNWPGKNAWDVKYDSNGREWTLVPQDDKTTLAPDEAIEVPISKIVTGHATGRTALRIRYSGLPGFSEGELVAYIQKYPLVYASHKVGIGTDSPSEKLTLEVGAGEKDGFTLTNGATIFSALIDQNTLRLGTSSETPLLFVTEGSTRMTLTADGKVGIGTFTPPHPLTVQTSSQLLATTYGITHTNVAQTVNGNVTTTFSTRLGSDAAGLGTESDHPLRFFTKGGSPQVTLATNGNLGIGALEPEEKLHVQGNLRINGQLKNHGPFIFWANTDKNSPDEDLARFLDKDGKQVLTLTSDGKLIFEGSGGTEKLYVKGSMVLQDNLNTLGAFKVYTDADNTGDEYAVRFLNKGNELFAVKPSGEVNVKGQKPIECWSGKVYWDNDHVTNYSTKDWLACIVGFHCKASDDKSDKNAGFHCWADGSGDKWVIKADLDNLDDTWFVQVIFIRRELVAGDYSYADA